MEGIKKENQGSHANRLINEAIKRILLDVVIRGHGDRLIGRWSREPEIQRFLEQVPYMLDRINQLHLACTRADSTLSGAQDQLANDHHHHYHHHHQSEAHELSQSSLNDFVNLIGRDRHWLVRSRDPLGLTPLHKAILFNNRPIAEYILDRYQDELAPISNSATTTTTTTCGQSSKQYRATIYKQSNNSSTTNTRLIDAQDKYGRTALHYAAFSLSESKQKNKALVRDSSQPKISYLYHFLISKGASLNVTDFRGKTATHYVRHSNQLRLRSIIHLSNKLNANHQANVLSKTLRAASIKVGFQEGENVLEVGDNTTTIMNTTASGQGPDKNRESLSTSCKDLSKVSYYQEPHKDLEEDTNSHGNTALKRSQSTMADNRNFAGSDYHLTPDQTISDNQKIASDENFDESGRLLSVGDKQQQKQQQTQVNICERQVSAISSNQNMNDEYEKEKDPHNQLTPETFSTSSISSLHSSINIVNDQDHPLQRQEKQFNNSNQTRDCNKQYNSIQKRLISDRCSRLIINQTTKLTIRRCLNEGVVDKINDLVAEGYGSYILSEVGVCCWNQNCKRYICNVVPNLLTKLDVLHEMIAENNILAVKKLLNNDPILARIRRPYKRAAMNALHLAIYLDRRSIVKYLIEHFYELINQKDSHGATCLHWAARCFKLDKIYFWLLDRFGRQLENVRDSKGKLASDYRQQAFRLSSNFDRQSNGQPYSTINNHRGRKSSVENILQKNQDDSNKLYLSGKKIDMKSRKQNQVAISQDPDRDKEDNLRTSSRASKISHCTTTCSQSETEMFERSIEIGIESPSSLSNQLNQRRQQNELFNNSDSLLHSDDASKANILNQANKVVPIVKRVSSASYSTSSRNNSSGDQEELERRHSDSSNRFPGKYSFTVSSIKENLKIPKKYETPNQETAHINERNNSFFAEDNSYLLTEMVQLDSEDLSKENFSNETRFGGKDESTGSFIVDDDYEDDSPLATPPNFVGSRPQSGSNTKNRIDSLIVESILDDNIKKLEHLILAGCGQRILNVYELQGKEEEISDSRLSEQMKNFLKFHTPEEMKRISSIYEVLHKCYAFSYEPAKLDLNITFHKLCNLLDKRRLIMARDCFGASPLHLALMRCDKRLVDYLLRRHPEAASAPDQESRNASHYAALVLSAYNHHGSFKLSRDVIDCQQQDSPSTSDRKRVTRDGDRMLMVSGYWQIDEMARIIYENICLRYGDLISVKDKNGLNSTDYLTQGRDSLERPISRTQYDESMASALIPASLFFGDSCPDYAKILTRYNYVVVRDDNNEEVDETYQVSSSVEDERSELGKQVAQLPEDPIDTAQIENNIQQNSMNNDMNQQQQTKMTTTTKSRATAESKEKQVSGSSIGSSRNESLDLVVDSNRSNSLTPIEKECDSIMPTQTVFERKQVAPKATVGSVIGSPPIVQSSTRLHTSGRDIDSQQVVLDRRARSPTVAKTIHRYHESRCKSKLLDDLDPNFSIENSILMNTSGIHQSSGSRNSRRNNHRRHHHHHHHHHHYHHKHGNFKNTNANQSIVGGVIVPTIIHNDRMDEIETYDIIYRQPTNSNAANNTTSSSSSGSFSSTTCSSSEEDEEGNAEVAAINNDNNNSSKSETISRRKKHDFKREFGKHINSPRGNNSNDNSSSTGSGSELEDEDDRVERLSNEFENRVRREKSELKARVDQIMSEIKLSAKSGRSSRFLASPSDMKIKPQQESSSTKELLPNNDSNVLVSSTATTTVKHNLEEKETNSMLIGNKINQQNQSLSSSGNSSARTSCSSASSLNSNSSRTKSCSSSSFKSAIISSSTNSASNSRDSSRSSYSAGSTLSKSSTAKNSQKSVNHDRITDNRGQVDRIQTKDKQANNLVMDSMIKQTNNHIALKGSSTPTNAANGNGQNTFSLYDISGQLISKNAYGQTYLHFIASRSQSASTLYKVLEHGRHLIGERDVFYRTARDVAVQFNLSNNVQILDKFIIDLFINNNATLLRHLLNQGYSPLIHVSDADGNDIMLILKLLKLDKMISFLLQMADFQRWRDELHTFIRNGYSAGVSELIKKHRDLVRAKSVHSRTSLHLAVLFERVNMIKELLDTDPSCVEVTDNMGRTALHYTYGLNTKSVEDIRKQLLDSKANSEARDVRMRTPKYYFIFKKEIEDIKKIELELN